MADNFELYRTAVFILEDARGEEGERKGDAKDEPRQGGVDWQRDFAVITAYNPDGAAPVGEDSLKPKALKPKEAEAEALRLNQAAHLRLRDDLLRVTKSWWIPSFLLPASRFLLRDRVTAVTGCSPDLVHQEPGWAANIPIDVALRLGRLYRQDAIFWVSGGMLYLVDARGATTIQQEGASGKQEERCPEPEPIALWSSRVRYADS